MFGQFKSVEVHVADRITSVACIIGGDPIGSNNQASFSVDGIDRVSKIFRFRPGAIELFAYQEQIVVAVAGPIRTGKIQRLIVGMQEWTLFVAGGIDVWSEIDRGIPPTVE